MCDCLRPGFQSAWLTPLGVERILIPDGFFFGCCCRRNWRIDSAGRGGAAWRRCWLVCVVGSAFCATRLCLWAFILVAWVSVFFFFRSCYYMLITLIIVLIGNLKFAYELRLVSITHEIAPVTKCQSNLINSIKSQKKLSTKLEIKYLREKCKCQLKSKHPSPAAMKTWNCNKNSNENLNFMFCF